MQRFTLRSNTTDLDRFKIMINRKQRNYEVRKLAHARLAPKGGKKAAKAPAAKAPAKGKGKK
jgi:hypothetical protein